MRHLNVTYNRGRSNEIKALRDISFDIFPGEFVIFFGPSGCGKSTLLYSISGLEMAAEGSVAVRGRDVIGMRTAERAAFHQKIIGMVFQAYYLIPSLTVLQNVSLPQLPLYGKKREREARAQSLLDRFGVGAQARKLPTELSGGQQQRVAMCRALMNEPLIIVADEPVGNLDTKSSEDVMNLLRSLNDDQRKTVILVTHDPSHLHHAHRIIYLRDGAVVGIKVNTPEERRESAVKNLASSGLPSALRHWAQTVTSDMLQGSSSVFAAAKAQEITAEVLTGMTLPELRILDDAVMKLIEGRAHGPEALYRTLHGTLAAHGLSMDKRRAERLARELAVMAKQVASLRRIEASAAAAADRQRVAQSVRRAALERTGGSLTDDAAAVVDQCILKHVEGTMDFAQLAITLDQPLRRGGAGLDRRFARRLARAIEPLVIPHRSTPSRSRR